MAILIDAEEALFVMNKYKETYKNEFKNRQKANGFRDAMGIIAQLAQTPVVIECPECHKDIHLINANRVKEETSNDQVQ